MSDRYKLTGLKGCKIIGFKRNEDRSEFIEILLKQGSYQRKIQVREDQLFDLNGNFFEINID